MMGTLRKYLIWFFLAIVAILAFFFFWPAKHNEGKNQEPKPLKTIIIQPTEKQVGTVIYLHGLGDNAKKQQNNLRQIAINHPHIKFIIPQAPTISVSMNWGCPMPAWYNIKGSIKDIMNLKQDKTGLLKSVQQIEQIIQGEVNKGINPEKIMVMGHSQGGSVVLAVGLTTKHKLGGIVCLSGFLPCREEIFSWVQEENKQIDFNFYHDTSDDMVPFIAGQKSASLLVEKGYSAKMNAVDEYWGSPHFTTVNNLAKFLPKELDKMLKN